MAVGPKKVGRNGLTRPVPKTGKNPRPTAKTEEKAKGLIGWKNGKKDPKATGPKVGNYKGKSLNLSNKQLTKAGVKNTSTLKTINISDTKFIKGKGVVNAATGKLVRGKIDMGGGNIAVYKAGKRVSLTKGAAKPSPSRGTSYKPTTKPAPKPRPEPKQKPKPGSKTNRPTAPASGYQAGRGMTTTRRPAEASTGNTMQFSPYGTQRGNRDDSGFGSFDLAAGGSSVNKPARNVTIGSAKKQTKPAKTTKPNKKK